VGLGVGVGLDVGEGVGEGSAEEILAELGEQASVTGRRWARIAALRSRATLAEGTRAEFYLEEAVALARDTGDPPTSFSVRKRSRLTSATSTASWASDRAANWRAYSLSNQNGRSP